MIYFEEKIIRIRYLLSAQPLVAQNTDLTPKLSVLPQFENFRLIERSDLCKIVSSSCATTSYFDPIPTWLLKASLPAVAESLTNIVNLSLVHAAVPKTLKKAIVCPLRQSKSLSSEELSNYRPVSTLSFFSKILERVVLAQLEDYLQSNNLLDRFQSAYRKKCSTETAVLKVQNDILRALDANKQVVLVLLDLSAAFDTIEHTSLLHRLSSRVGITGSVLRWISSYLSDRTQQVKISESLSTQSTLKYGVPQGSV